MSFLINVFSKDLLSIKRKALSFLKKPTTLFILGVAVMGIFIYWVAHFPSMIYNSKYYQIYCETGQIGDTLGGIMGPPIAIVGAILTFLAFYIQYWANIEQKKQFQDASSLQVRHFEDTLEQQNQHFVATIKLQTEESNRQANIQQQEKIESRFFELVRMHKDNINEINLSENIFGRKSFEEMLVELRWIHLVVDRTIKYYIGHVNTLPTVSEIDLLRFSYKVFFYGVDILGSNIHRKKMTPEETEILSYCLPHFQDAKLEVERIKGNHPGIPVKIRYQQTLNSANDNIKGEFYSAPAQGHANQLGHLYRHLYLTCQYILKQEALDFDQKKEYIKILRAQLSNNEQIMLYYNAISWFKQEWDELFVDYQFIHNIPIDILDMGQNIEKLYESEILEVWNKFGLYMFEHQSYRPK